ncbi:hypothetical protein Tco_0636856 [Tanacetum coccineum]
MNTDIDPRPIPFPLPVFNIVDNEAIFILIQAIKAILPDMKRRMANPNIFPKAYTSATTDAETEGIRSDDALRAKITLMILTQKAFRQECILQRHFWRRARLKDFRLPISKPPLSKEERTWRNECYSVTVRVLSLAKNPVYHKRTKHINVRLNFIRDVLEEDRFSIQKIATEHNPADMLTKALPTEKKETSKRDSEEPLAVREIPSQGGDYRLSDLDLAIYYSK